ncbi:oligopeptide/dipeptide ABC transporter ATP-binding protein [Zavarzinia sp. CC-PAN008]|uniref:oligopeptide/dipeptide ABC transporter ATP-binding protein n=1 Tax=Zavarzinia sp. CC-PAN008 TaxID=3243332 RepID=UPI003F743A90
MSAPFPVLEVTDAVVRVPGSTLFDRLLGRGPAHLEIVAGVSLSLARGETLGLVGESGSGKTTLGRAILGLTPLSSGAVRIDGRQADGFGDGPWRPLRREAAMMFQDPVASLDPRMTVFQAVTEPVLIQERPPLRARGHLRPMAARLIERVGLPRALLDRYPHELSGGQARRVSVARALALRPKLVVADEPTAGLDLSIQGELLNLLDELQKDLGMSILLITHNLGVTRHVTDRTAVMYLGRLVETGPTASVFARPAHPYTRALLEAKLPRARGVRAAPLAGEVPSLRRRPPACEFHTRCPLAQDICRSVAPPETAVDGAGHSVRCHFPNVRSLGAAA